MARKKIALIGAGNIGGELANQLVQKQLGDVVLFDIPQKEGVAKGKALDLEQASALSGADAKVSGTSNWNDVAGADVLIITAGIPRKPGQSRDDLVASNLPIIRDVADNAKKFAPNAFSIVVSNPLDAMVYEFQRRTGFPSAKVAGMAGALDSARYQLFLAREVGVSVKDVRTLVLGGHGDEMVPLTRHSNIAGIPLKEYLPADKLEAIVARTRKGGGEIVNLLKTGSAYYAPSLACSQMAEAILKNKHLIVPCAAYMDGEYGLKDMFFGVPVMLGRSGIEKIIEYKFDDDERAMFEKSAASVRETHEALKKLVTL